MFENVIIPVLKDVCRICALNSTCQHNPDHECKEVVEFFAYHYSGYVIRTHPLLRYDR